ncbi:DNA polymerase III delta subunit [Streptococcus sp. DD10]|uniref:DNA polymerase III subunit delta n=1 Tax=Streptococcus sp. DD10 TaxID=1777878 RepID=UPI000794DF17|nr:DNA polymerase III subunit delta [Streptococcus sp. DD10]KXT76503.1 DNA polymerase III delta subunit [Streptococcus sp. DD10]
MLAIEAIKSITEETLPALTIVTGDDVGQFEILKSSLLQAINFESSSLHHTYFDTKSATYAQIELDLQSLPFFSDQKIVILDHFQDITTAKKRWFSDDELKALEAYLLNPIETTKLIIFAEGKLDSKRRLVKILKKNGYLLEASELKEQELRAYFEQKSTEEGLLFEPQVFEQLLVKSAFNFSELSKNIAFLKSYKGKGKVEEDDIKVAIPKTLQDNIFDLTQLVLSNKLEAARQLVHDLTLQGEDEVKLIAIMLGQLRMFLYVKLLAECGQNEQQITSSLSDYLGRKVNPYQVKFALRDSRQLTSNRLKNSIINLIEADYQIKMGIYTKDFLFELALLKISRS